MEHWTNSWEAFVDRIRQWLQDGVSLGDIGERLMYATVRWKGQVKEKELNVSERSPLVVIRMSGPNLETPDGRCLATDKLLLFFDASPEAVAPWWHIPIGTPVEFETTIYDDSGECIGFGLRSLSVRTVRNPMLVSPAEHRDSSSIPEGLYACLRKAPPQIVKTLELPFTGLGRAAVGEPARLKWSQKEYQNRVLFAAEVPSGTDFFQAMIPFWHRVFEEGPRRCTGDWRVVLIKAQQENATLCVEFYSDDLQEVEPVLFQFSSTELAESLLRDGLAEWDKGIDAVIETVMTAMSGFWENVYSAICSEPVISELRQLASQRQFRIYAADIETDRVVELKVPREEQRDKSQADGRGGPANGK